ncbi:hypothetical protein PV327_000838 [Microctonus hyperodae]|uniref:Regulatory protein zeste n=1 Tax=Microctonus hyperodae TaxID=165561 RepID=A0AA39G7H6_MICHY|nr:hypothetical protein PV327_000838 [Microctonus hyperodae]
MTSRSKSRNFTPVERSLFLELLKDYAHIIERKKNDAASLQEKEDAWAMICDNYNSSSLITEERTIYQLKKLRTNLKQAQKEALIRESELQLEQKCGEEISIVKKLQNNNTTVSEPLSTVPTLFSSNMLENVMDEQRNQLVGSNCIIVGSSLDCKNDDKATSLNESVAEDDDCGSSSPAVVTHKNESNSNAHTLSKSSKLKTLTKSNFPKPRIIIRPNNSLNTIPKFKTIKPCIIKNLNVDEEKVLKIKRLKLLIDQEQELFNLKKKHDEEIYALTLEHTKKKYNLEIRAATATAELSELLLKRENITEEDD